MSTSLVKGILKWTDEQMEKIENNIDEVKHPYIKAFGIGAIEGAIDSLVVTGTIVAVAGVVTKVISKKK